MLKNKINLDIELDGCVLHVKFVAEKDTKPKVKTFEHTTDLSESFEILEFVDKKTVVKNIIDNILTSLMYQMFDYQLQDLLDGFLSEDDPIYKDIKNRKISSLSYCYFESNDIKKLHDIINHFF